MRKALLWTVLLVVLVSVNVLIAGKEKILARGDVMLLQLAPVDPRSLLQGDFMALRYRLADEVNRQLSNTQSADGQVIVRIDQDHVAQFARLRRSTEPLGAGEKLLYFRKRGDVVRIASDAFFFQEGQGKLFATARYGELRVDANGDAVLVGLRDSEFKVLSTH